MPNRTATFAVTLLVGFTMALSAVPAAAQKSSSPNWPCVITFENLLSYQAPDGTTKTIATAVQGDGQGPYVHGKEGVQCYVNRGTTSGNYGNLFVNADRTSPRYFLFPGQSAVTAYTRSGYDTFENRQPGYFEITRLDSAVTTDGTLGGTFRRRVRIGVGFGELWGDSTSTDPLVVGSSSAWVTPLSNCSWKLAWYPWAADPEVNAYVDPRILALRESGQSPKTRIRTADFAMPFAATVTVTGVKTGCGA